MGRSLLGVLHALDAMGVWPMSKILAVLKRQYERVDAIGEEAGYRLFGIVDHGVAFVIALMQAEGANGKISGVAFLARFTGFSVDQATVEYLNRNLHLGVASVEADGDLYLLAGVEAAGDFQEGAFTLILEAWRRDLVLVLHSLSGASSIGAAFPIARSQEARAFAVNRAPEGADGDLLKTFLAAGATKTLCNECMGRGRIGLVARACEVCGGAGLIEGLPARR